MPTGETALWLGGGDDLDRRFEVQQIPHPGPLARAGWRPVPKPSRASVFRFGTRFSSSR